MAVTPLPFLDRTAATFKTDVDAFFAQKLPQFSIEVNQVASAADASASAANTSKNAAATSATNAATSATNASNSATAANTSKTNAATSETNAANSATAANSSKNAAAGSATAAATSATNSEASAVRAKAAADSIASGPVTSVNGKTGAPVLNKTDIGLSSVDNVSVVAHGIKDAGLMSDTANIDSLLLGNGWFSFGPNTTGTKPPGADRGVFLNSGRAYQTDARITQMWFEEAANKIHTRRNVGGTWYDWAELTLPSVTGLARKPLTTGEASSNQREWSDTLSIPKYIDKVITGTPGAALALNLSLATVFDLSPTVNLTLSLSNIPSLDTSVSPTAAGESLTVVVRVRQNASPKTVTWWSGISWLTPGGLTPPTPTANQIVEYILSTANNGTLWVGRVGAST